jgi:hypothetical protein
MRNVVAMLFLLVTGPTLAAGFQPFAGPTPELVWIQPNSWAMVMGSDTPQFVLYDNGQVIYAKLDGREFTYHSCVLNESQVKEVRQNVAAVLQVKTLKQWYSLVHATDQPIASFFFHPTTKSDPIIVEAYGLAYPDGDSRGSRALEAEKKLYPDEKRDEVPTELMSLDKYLGSFDVKDCPVWQPQYIEVMIWSFDYAKTAPVTWPKDWPGLNSERTMPRHDGAYSIFLDGVKLSELQKLLAPLDEGGAMILDGKKWAVAFRPAVPSEPVWRTAFEKVEEQQ